jgi:threonyl-tRNA synthetase
MVVLPISEKSNDYAKAVQEKLTDAQLRVDCDLSDEKIDVKIAKAHSRRVPYMLVVGPKEVQSGSVNVRIRGEKETKTVEIDKFVAIAQLKIAEKKIELALED